MDRNNYIHVRNSEINYYREIPLFYQTGTDSYGLYKPAGTSLPEMRISQQRHPLLYIQEEDRIVAIKELQKGFNKQIEQSLTTGNAVNVIIREKNKFGGDVALGALEHHEKLDGSGYPKGTRNISYVGQLLGIIDCYEALTNEDRPYRRAREPLETLKFLKEDVQAGKFNRDIFEKFCYSLI